MSNFWTKERELVLLKMWNSGETAQAIYECLGATSRNAVIGRLRRLGASKRSNSDPCRRYKKQPTPKMKTTEKSEGNQKNDLSQKIMHHIIFSTGEYAHLGGVALTKKEVYSWKGTNEQARNLISQNPLYRRMKCEIVRIGRVPMRKKINRY